MVAHAEISDELLGAYSRGSVGDLLAELVALPKLLSNDLDKVVGVLALVFGTMIALGGAGGASVFGVGGAIAGRIILIVGLLILGVAVGLWNQRLWALVLAILVLPLLWGGGVRRGFVGRPDHRRAPARVPRGGRTAFRLMG